MAPVYVRRSIGPRGTMPGEQESREYMRRYRAVIRNEPLVLHRPFTTKDEELIRSLVAQGKPFQVIVVSPKP